MILKNDMMMLNDIIYKIYTIKDFDTMRSSVLSSLKLLVPYEVATFSLAKPDTAPVYELTDPVCDGLEEGRWEHYEKCQDMDYTRWTFSAPIAKAYRESDLMSDEDRVKTPYYQNILKPTNVHYSAILTIVHNGRFYGCIDIFRSRASGDFSDEEMLMLDMLKDHLSYRLASEKGFENDDASAASAHPKNGRHYPGRDQLINIYDLTNREAEITLLLLNGMGREEIAEELSISLNTLKKHTSHIYRKTGAKGYRELIKIMESSE